MNYVNGLALADGERVIRKYEASVLKKPKSNGYLIATNRRLIFSGEASGVSGRSLLVREVKIDQVSGIDSFYGRGWSIGKLVLAIILIVVFIFLSQMANSMYLSGLSTFLLFGLLWPAFLIYKMITNPGNQMALQIIASNQSPSAIGVSVEQGTGVLGSLFSSLGLGGNHAWMAVAAAGPGRHTETMVRELGALIQDIQVMGDHAIEKWNEVELKGKRSEQVSQGEIVRSQLATTVDKTRSKIQEKVSASSAAFYCQCGHPVESNDLFCGNCGSKVTKDNDEEIFG
ncbi:zinc ribbon domain-containing protein [Priestia megaterium]|uniref:zinc ribbon domain-containing protein n=1 Tax=Priestia megaterium TaxID=1404 RepID=UPI000BFE779E|nr:zinc ribbon domain-containing protein [Priestia megaterium]MED4139332.1 zinc ribbon domain-containing protein [Priestia megaterium]PGR03311.1 hypothetical protein COA23_21660 [Priestia megaterium]